MSSPSFSPIAVAAEESHCITRRGLRPAIDAALPLLRAITDDAQAEAAIGVTGGLARTRGAIPTVLLALGLTTRPRYLRSRSGLRQRDVTKA
jgi:hypothetical protein